MLILFIVTGLIAGMFSGIFGVGGGLVIVPSLIFFAKMNQRTAVGTSLGALLLPVGTLGVYAYWRAGNLDVKAALWIGLGMLVGAYGGALISQSLSEAVLRRAMAVLLLIVAARMWMTS